MNEQTYTVFTECADFLSTACGAELRLLTLQELIEHGIASYGLPYVAWAAEAPASIGGTVSRSDLFDESIAAGRIIKQIDGKFIPFGEGAPAYCDAQGEPISNEVARAIKTIERLTFKPETLREYKIRESASTEKKRPALTWNTPASSERFPGFSVQSETHPDEPTTVHALQRLAEGDPRCGSAWLLG